MKKIFSKEIFFTLFFILTLFVSVNKVSADVTQFDVYYNVEVSATVPNGGYSETKYFIENYSSEIKSIFTHFMEQYEQYSSTYSYYFCSLSLNEYNGTIRSIQLNFYVTSALPTITYNQTTNVSYELFGYGNYNLTDDTIYYYNNGDFQEYSSSIELYRYVTNNYFYSNSYFFSNFDLRFTGFPNTITTIGYEAYNLYTREWLVDSASSIPTYYDYLELSFLSEYDNDQYTEVNLNDYAYVILSFRDYVNLHSPSKFDVIGNFCLTSAYDYGLKPKSLVTDVCSPHYTSYTPTYVYTTSSDLSNGVIYYLKALDTSYDNKIKINTGIYNITYITSENQYSPVIYVNGRPYSPTPYNELPSTSITNTQNNYVPGATCNVGDPDCLYSNSGIDIDNLFTHPLQLLQSLWGSITQFFTIVAAFMTVLPTELQTFLYVGFMLAVVIGIIKIIIG